MGQSIALVRIMPESVDVDLAKIEAQIKKTVNVQKLERSPIAFGLNAIIVTVLVGDEAAGGTDVIEEKLGAIKGVSEVTIERVSLIS